MAGLTDPFELKQHLRSKPAQGFDAVPFFDALLIALFIALNSSAFVLSPGTSVELPTSHVLESPESTPSAVLTVGRNELYFFQGKKLARLTLFEHLKEFVDTYRGQGVPILLLKADGSIPSSSLFNLMDIARQAGFGEVHLAAELDTQPGAGAAGADFDPPSPDEP